MDEVYKIFSKFGITKLEFDKLIAEIKLDRKKTSAVLNDLMLCSFAKNGLKYKHLMVLSKVIMGQRIFRCTQLRLQLNYLTDIVKQIEDKNDV